MPSRSTKVYLSVLAMLCGVVATGCDRSKTTATAEHHTSKVRQTPTASGKKAATPEPADLSEFRRKLDETVWAPELDAQHFERFFVQLWDRLRSATDKLAVLESTPFKTLTVPQIEGAEALELDVIRFRTASKTTITMDRKNWKTLATELRQRQFQVLESEWHHSKFDPTADPVRSEVDFVLHLVRPLEGELTDTAPQQRAVVRGKLLVEWNEDRNSPEPSTVEVNDLEILVRTGLPAFQQMMTCERRPDQYGSALPIIVYDLNGDQFPEIIISRWNRVYWNDQGTRFREDRLLKHFQPLAEAGLMVDVTTDGFVDFVTVSHDGELLLFEGNSDGTFAKAPRAAAMVQAPDALAITAGDVDADGDVDLWLTQYVPSYVDGQMPTPFFDANDGQPAYLLLNDGAGNFSDNTERSGLQAKRNRRTYSSSFVDTDSDGDLDLIVVSDYAGIDLYQNDGSGFFRDVTDTVLPERHLFGMAHTIGDFNGDGNIDLYAIGMSSTTARRLDQLGLGRKDAPEIHRMRPKMAYGNRMLLGTSHGHFAVSPHADQVARTGWSWEQPISISISMEIAIFTWPMDSGAENHARTIAQPTGDMTFTPALRRKTRNWPNFFPSRCSS